MPSLRQRALIAMMAKPSHQGTTVAAQMRSRAGAAREPMSDEQAATAMQAVARGRKVRLGKQGWKSVKKVVATTGSLLKKVRIKRMADLPLALASAGSTTTLSVKSQEELANMRLWEQGDEAMYTREALEARYSNRSDKRVWEELNLWWEAAMAYGAPPPLPPPPPPPPPPAI